MRNGLHKRGGKDTLACMGAMGKLNWPRGSVDEDVLAALAGKADTQEALQSLKARIENVKRNPELDKNRQSLL